MRGYLQRLVSTANGVAPLVQPLIRPVFSPAAPPAEQASSMLGDDARPTQQYRAASASAHVPRSVDTRQENDAEDPSRKTAHEAVPRMSLAALSNFEPLLTPEPTTLEVANITTAPSRQSSKAAVLTQASAASAGTDQVRVSTGSTTAYLPLLNARPTALPHEPLAYKTQEHKQPELPKPTAQPRPAPVSSAAPDAPDEIQIHIGRIEITAVPAPVKAAPQKPVYSGPSLQEYLKRPDRSSQ